MRNCDFGLIPASNHAMSSSRVSIGAMFSSSRAMRQSQLWTTEHGRWRTTTVSLRPRSPSVRWLQAARNQELHDLVGARIYACHACVPVHARNRIFLHITIAAEQLQATLDDPPLQISDPVFRHRGSDGVQCALEVPVDAIVMEYARNGGLGLAFGKHKLRVLELNYFLAERIALFDVIDGKRERPLQHRLGMHHDDQPLARKIVHKLREALPFLAAEHVFRRQSQVFKKELGGVRRIKTELLELAATAEPARTIGFDHHQRGPPGASALIRFRPQHDQ